MYDIIIVGAGPAGLTAAIYGLRADKKVLILEKESFGGQITHSPKVENYPGYMQMSGNEFAEILLDQVTAHGADIELDEVTGIRVEDDVKIVTTPHGEYEGKTVIIATGSKHRKLGVPGEDELEGDGVSYCAVCDGAFFAGKSVAIIGGGNSALQEALQLSDRCSKVTLVQNLGYLTGEEKLQKILLSRGNIRVIYNTVVESIERSGALTVHLITPRRTVPAPSTWTACSWPSVRCRKTRLSPPFVSWIPRATSWQTNPARRKPGGSSWQATVGPKPSARSPRPPVTAPSPPWLPSVTSTRCGNMKQKKRSRKASLFVVLFRFC